MPTWDARAWVAGLMGLEPDELAVRSIDRYGPMETQVRYERGSEAVARLTVNGPVLAMLVPDGQGYWDVKAQIGPGTGDVHRIQVPQADEIVY